MRLKQDLVVHLGTEVLCLNEGYGIPGHDELGLCIALKLEDAASMKVSLQKIIKSLEKWF